MVNNVGTGCFVLSPEVKKKLTDFRNFLSYMNHQSQIVRYWASDAFTQCALGLDSSTIHSK